MGNHFNNDHDWQMNQQIDPALEFTDKDSIESTSTKEFVESVYRQVREDYHTEKFHRCTTRLAELACSMKHLKLKILW
jgi:hypothetical protein